MKYLKYFRLAQFFIHLKNTKFRLTFIIRKSNKDGQPAVLLLLVCSSIKNGIPRPPRGLPRVLLKIYAPTAVTSSFKLACKFTSEYLELHFPMLSARAKSQLALVSWIIVLMILRHIFQYFK